MDSLQRIRLFLQLASFRKSFDLLSNLKSFYNLSASLTNSQNFLLLNLFELVRNYHFFNCFSVGFFSFEISSWNCSYLNRALRTDFIKSAVMVILLAVTFLDVTWLWIILREARQFSDWFFFIYSLFALNPRSTVDCPWLKLKINI